LLKKALIFFVLAELAQGFVALVVSPEHFINFLLTWDMFHIFALTTLFFLFVFESSWQMEIWNLTNYKQATTLISLFFLAIILSTFLLFHDYSVSTGIQWTYTDLDIFSIFQRIFFDYGLTPIIPFFSYPILGGLLAMFLDLPHEEKNTVLKKAIPVLIIGIITLIVGIMFLRVERFVSTPVSYPASSSFVFIAIGTIILVTITGIGLIDVDSLNSPQKINKVLLPFVVLSKISLTVFIIHNAVYIIPSEFVQSFINSETGAMMLGILYSLLFIPIAFIWQKWEFKYSVEWMIWKLQSANWR
jgi:hypothetical protein